MEIFKATLSRKDWRRQMIACIALSTIIAIATIALILLKLFCFVSYSWMIVFVPVLIGIGISSVLAVILLIFSCLERR